MNMIRPAATVLFALSTLLFCTYSPAAEPSSLIPMLLKGRHFDGASTTAALQPYTDKASGNGFSTIRKKEESGPSPASDNGRVEAKQKRDDGRSSIEKILSGQFPTYISRELIQFGYDFFDPTISTFAPVTSVPVGPDYIIGPGDGFTIHLWGKAEENYEVEVSPDGSIQIPRVGACSVSGMRFEELKPYLSRKFKEYYPDFEMSVSMGRLRTVEIFVVGEARNPGTYNLSSLSTVISSLYAAGGPSKNGSLRNVQIIRPNGKTRVVDLYEFLISGIKKNDIRIQAQDTLFIPVIGPVVGVSGNVKRPAIYEMKGGENIGHVLKLAGGLLPTGELQNVVVERIKGHQRRVIRSFNLDPSGGEAGENLKAPLQDGDLVKIYPIHNSIGKAVHLEGHVKYPREYEWKSGMRLLELIPSYNALLDEPYLPQAKIVRLTPPDSHPEIIPFNLGGLLAGDEKENLALQEMDRVVISSAWEKKDRPEVTIKGAVRKEGGYRLYKGMTVKDLIFEAGSFTRAAYLEEAVLSRVMPGKTGTDTVVIRFSPKGAIEGKPQDNIALKEDDHVHIREMPQYREALERKVTLEGAFVFAGEYAFAEGERISSVIARAGFLTADAYPFGAVFLRESAREMQRQRLSEYMDRLEEEILTASSRAAETSMEKEQAALLQQNLTAKKQLLEKLRKAQPTGRMVIDLEEILAKPFSEKDIQLRAGDTLIVGKRPDYVNVLGDVYNPTALFAEKGRSVEYYLNKVGGPTKDADEDQIYLVRANGAVASKSQKRFFAMESSEEAKSGWGGGEFDSLIMGPGDTLIVPRETVKYPWLGITKGITEIMYHIAVAAGVLIVAF
ncbi:MAG: polysaccharide biosynthesis protein [Desulfobacteraceae bacterium]|nr:MAG: polysaccharide biosynthesis protein [Desulfobacteraceae bacterium]